MTIPEGRAPIDRDDLAKLAGHPSTYKAEIEILKAKLARAEARKPVVKKLYWIEFGKTSMSEYHGTADSSCGVYKIQQDFFPEEYFTAHLMKEKLPGVFGTVEEAKAACQADYQERICSAIEWKETP